MSAASPASSNTRAIASTWGHCFYQRHHETFQDWLNASFQNAYLAGQAGLYTYNNQDHAMMAAILAVRNRGEGAVFDVWSVNTDDAYGEEGVAAREIEARLVLHRLPRPVAASTPH